MQSLKSCYAHFQAQTAWTRYLVIAGTALILSVVLAYVPLVSVAALIAAKVLTQLAAYCLLSLLMLVLALTALLPTALKIVLGALAPITLVHICVFNRFYWRALCLLLENYDPTGKNKSAPFWDIVLYAGKLPTLQPYPDELLLRSGELLGKPNRTSFATLATYIASELGLTTYHYQCANRDIGDGSRAYYWGSDLDIKPRPVTIGRNHLVVMTDVDYYVDMPEFLSEHPNLTLLYTMVPKKAACESKHLTYTFTEEGKIKVQYPQSASFEHPLWNYGGDCYKVQARWYQWRHAISYYHVYRRQLDAHHMAVLLIPYWVGPTWLSWLAPPAETFGRLNVVDHGFARVRSLNSQGAWEVSTSAVQQFAEVTLPVKVDDELILTNRIGTHLLPVSTLEAHLREAEIPLPKRSATIMAAFFKAVNNPKPAITIATAQAVRNYQAAGVGQNDDAKPSLEAFMTPLMHGAFAPVRSNANDQWAIDSRVTDVRKSATMTTQLERFAHEFIARLMGIRRKTLVPCEPLDVAERQNRRAQLNLLETADRMPEGLVREPVVQSFQKSEAYQNVQAPRVISTIEPVPKLHYSKFMYALADVLKTVPWYAFSRSPRSIATRVATLCRAATHNIISSDFSRFDGTVSPALRKFEEMLLDAAFDPGCVKEAQLWHGVQHHRRCFTGYGVTYDSGDSRLSGSPETSVFNTCANALIAYTAYRLEGRCPDRAWASLGVYGGDDGLSPDMSAKTFQQAATMWGPVAKCEESKRESQDTLRFLARIYGPGVWHGDASSMCDLKRTLSHFHTTVKHTDSPLTKFTQKMAGLSRSDACTPIIRDLVYKSHELGVDIFCKPTAEYANYYAKAYEHDEQYVQHEGDWYFGVLAKEFPEFDYPRFRAWISTVKDTYSLLSPPLFVPVSAPEIKSDRPVVVDEQLLPPTQPEGPALQQRKAETPNATHPTPVQDKRRNRKSKSGTQATQPAASTTDKPVSSRDSPKSRGKRANRQQNRPASAGAVSNAPAAPLKVLITHHTQSPVPAARAPLKVVRTNR